MSRADAERLAAYWNGLTEAGLGDIARHYTEDIDFADPFNAVHGLAEFERVMRHMYEALVDPRFTVDEVIHEGDRAMFAWEFAFAFRRFRPGTRHRLRGVSHLRFAPDGRVAWQRDHWDAAELYEKLPGLGALMRALRRRAGSS